MSTITERSILIVHGRDFKPAEAALREISVTALRAGLERDFPDCLESFDQMSTELAYYGDLGNTLLQSSGKRYDESLDIGDRNNALAALRAITERKRFGIRQYDRLPGKSALREFAAFVGAPLFGACGMTMRLVSLVSKDAAEYFKAESDYADKVRERVRKKLCEHFDRGNKVLLMTHGLGCVIAYDVLWELSHDDALASSYGNSKVDVWLTLGAPLGDNHIRKRLLGADENLEARFPTNVISWYNVSAEDDYTCHDNTLADDFKQMLHHRLVSTVHDYRIYNLAVRYGKSNPHSSVGYYIHPRVAKVLADWLTAEQVGEVAKYSA